MSLIQVENMESKIKLTKSHNKTKSKSNGTLNTIENGALDFHVTPINSHSSHLSVGPQCKLYYKSNGEIDKSIVNGCRTGGVNVNLTALEEKENGLEKDIMLTDELVRQKAFKWCQDSLGGAWSLVTSKEELVISPVCGGMSNYLYLISLPPCHNPTNSEPTKVLLRIYGEISKSTMDFLVHNSVVFVLLAEKQLGPKPYGMYHDGRIEEYIMAEPLQSLDLARQDVMSMISKKLAVFHSLNMPLCKKPSWFRNIVRGWMDEVQNNKATLGPTLAAIQKLSQSVDLVKEFEMLIKIASDLHAPVVFCHNDLQAGNLLYQPASADKPANLTIIDWEYAHYNYRGHDIANHFNEWTFQYSSSGLPGYAWIPEQFPTREQQYTFYKSYLEATGVSPVTDEILDNLYKETNYLILHSHFIWGFWSLVQALTSGIEFDYKDYAVCRFEGYFKQKEKLVKLFGGLEGQKK